MVAALICYPPFVYGFTGQNGIIQYECETASWGYCLAGQTVVPWIWAVVLVALTVVCAWATAAFGVRFSNLTYRGVLAYGPALAWARPRRLQTEPAE